MKWAERAGFICLGPFADLGMREDLGVTPAPALTSGALAAVPVVVSLWIVFLTGIHAIFKRKEQTAEKEKQAAIDEILMVQQEKLNKTVAQLKEKAKNPNKRQPSNRKWKKPWQRRKKTRTKQILHLITPETRRENKWHTPLPGQKPCSPRLM
ncbi:MAG: hypothetical protein R2874_11960 [Desulfobacterales bacterium]